MISYNFIMLCNVILLKKYYRQVIDIVYPTQKKSKKDTEVYSVHLTYINVHISYSLLLIIWKYTGYIYVCMYV